jgi:DNA-binding transcriptional LysR family regulator
MLYSFTGGSDGGFPHGNLIAALITGAAGKLYGMTISGGGLANVGTVFEIGDSGFVFFAGTQGKPNCHGQSNSKGVRAKQIIICNSQSTVVKMTAHGMGMGFVPVECVRPELEARVLTLVPVRLQLPTNLYVTIYPVGEVEPALSVIIDVMRELAATLMAGG